MDITKEGLTKVTAAAEYKSNVGLDTALLDAYDPEYLDAEPLQDEDETAARQALNARMAEWYGIG